MSSASRRCFWCNRAIRAVASRVAHRHNPAQTAIRDQTQDHGVFRINVAAERAGQQNPCHRAAAMLIEQKRDPGVQRRLRQLDGAHVVLSHDDGRSRRALCGRSECVNSLSPVEVDKRMFALPEAAIGADDPGQEHLSHRFDDAGAADARRQDVVARLPPAADALDANT